jgi:DNA-binding MarR family transcriptional regulator
LTDAEQAERPAAQVVMILLRVFRSLERVDCELTPQQYRILKLAGAGGERSAKLAERLAVAKPTLTAIADGLVAAGYARRDAEPGDRRVVRLCLTASGRAAVDRADEVYGIWLDRLLGETRQPELVLQALTLLDQGMDELRSTGRAVAGARSGDAPAAAPLRRARPAMPATQPMPATAARSGTPLPSKHATAGSA